jgi:outer membrane immunogenic protein
MRPASNKTGMLLKYNSLGDRDCVRSLTQSANGGGGMKRLVLGSLALAAMIAGPAMAADQKVKMLTKAPPPPIFSWTGFYFGGFLGLAETGSVSSPDGTNPATVTGAAATFLPGTPAICDGGTPGLKAGCIANYALGASLIGGGTAGYNLQFGKAVVGLEAEFGYIHLSGSGTLPFIAGAPCVAPGNPCVSTMSTTVGDWYGTAAGRLGVTGDAINPAWSNQVLIYAKGGAAVTHLSTSEIISPGPINAAAALVGGRDVWGFVAGGGVEWVVGQDWSMKLEYEHLGFQKSATACGILPVGALGAGGTWCTQTSIRGIETGKIGFNRHF